MCQIPRITQKGKDTGYFPLCAFPLKIQNLWKQGCRTTTGCIPVYCVFYHRVCRDASVGSTCPCLSETHSLVDLREPLEWQKTWRLDEKSKNGPLSVSFDGIPLGSRVLLTHHTGQHYKAMGTHSTQNQWNLRIPSLSIWILAGRN